MTDSIPQISVAAAFMAGLLSFVSPCVLPLMPSYVSYITGLSVEQLSDVAERRRFRSTILTNSLLFIAGFSTVFIAFGASASLIGQWLMTYQDFIRKLGGALIMVFGLSLLGALRLPFLSAETRTHFKRRPAGYLGSFLIGVAFAAGWTPCVGPVLGTILLYAGTTHSLLTGVGLLTAYSLGLALPLLLTTLGIDRFLAYFKQVRAYLWGVSVVSGVFLVIVGGLIYANSLSTIASFLEQYGIGWYLGQ
ncbi:MAG: cytochrome c biogenesis protein CcdA [Nitrospira sp.]|nr:MAG: cytochrome c biogenesis protein CcdA [Nitrospira sp.]